MSTRGATVASTDFRRRTEGPDKGGTLKRKRWLVGVSVLAMVAMVAACGDDDDDSGSAATSATSASAAATTAAASATTAAAATTSAAGSTAASASATTAAGPPVTAPGIKDGKIIVGGVNQESAFGGLGDGAKARFDRFNKESGVNGLTIDFVGVRDDGGDTDRNNALAHELVEKDGVYAVVPTTPTFMQPAVGDYLKSKNVPYIGYGYAPVMCNDYAFAFNGCTVPGIAKTLSTGSIASLLPLLNKPPTDGSGVKIALVGRAESGGQLFTDSFQKIAEHLKMDVVYAKANVPGGGTADMQPFSDAIVATSPDIVQVITDFPSALALKAKMIAGGYKGIAADNAAYVPGLLESSAQAAAALEGTYVVTTYPTLLENTAFAKQMTTDLTGVTIKTGTVIGYLQAELFISLLEKVNPNFDKFAATVNAGTTITPADGGIPTKWPDFHTGGAPCTSVVKVENKAYKLVVPFACYEAFTPS
jgi:branched-chain amino acid transport system substrate-binding protein